ncbi:putative C-type lectin domain family 20 member A [Erinaceus europaeus]|uniref:C-type lectin domain family 20 member A n=1 Tax=Erinaceus europaeus TaxID=9365 RepID=A0ABM3XW75_ERIEU|nr:putative C-type lectin domain family 20 member A [Erinaceus europaeus]
MSWDKALDFCRRYETDLADLQSMTSLNSVQAIYSCLQRQDAWIGLHFDISTQGLVWSSGTAFTELKWSGTPALQGGFCATVYINMAFLPSLSAASCTTEKPFICYYDEKEGHRVNMEPALSLTTSPKPAVVQIGRRTFVRLDQTRTWLHALWYCRNYYTDLADLQTVTEEESNQALRSITTKMEAWIGLYFNANSGALNWSSDLGNSVPSWLWVPQMGVGLCAGLGIFSKTPPRVYATDCSSLRPFICFLDTSIGHRIGASSPPLFPSLEGTTETMPRQRISTRLEDPNSMTQIQHQVTLEHTEPTHHKPLGDISISKEEPWTPQTPMRGAFSSTMLPAVTREGNDPDIRLTATASEAQHLGTSKHPESQEPPAPKSGNCFKGIQSSNWQQDNFPLDQVALSISGQLFGILKADFTIPALMDPEEMKDQFLSEIEEALKYTLGAKKFSLEGVGLEVNKK